MLANLLNRRAGCVNRARPDLWGVWGASPIFTRWVDITVWGDYYIKKLGIKENTMKVLTYSDVHPSKITMEDINLDFLVCTTKDFDKLKKIMKIMNDHIKNIRGNIKIWTQVLKNYSNDFNIPYVEPQKFYYIKGTFNPLWRLKEGDFDL